jgi:hypothetical protein
VVVEDGEGVMAKSDPAPLRLIICGLPGALSLIVTDPVLGPVAVGAKATEIVQLAPAARLLPQLVFRRKVLGAIEIGALNVSVAVPLFVSVTVCGALVLPTGWLVNVRLVGERVAAGAGDPPPLRTTVCVDPAVPLSLSVTTSEPLRGPDAVGVKVTLIEQFDIAATVLPQVSAEMAKSPVIATPEMLRVAPPELARVTLWAVLVAPTGSEGNVKLAVESETLGTRRPVPLKGTLWGLLGALSTRIRSANRVPEALGVKVTLMAQLAPGARGAEQVLLKIANSEAFTPVMVGLLKVKLASPVLVTTTACAALVVLTT